LHTQGRPPGCPWAAKFSNTTFLKFYISIFLAKLIKKFYFRQIWIAQHQAGAPALPLFGIGIGESAASRILMHYVLVF